MLRVEFDGSSDVREQVGKVVPAGIEVKLVRDVLTGELLIEQPGTLVEAKVIAIADVEVDVEFADRRGISFRQGERVISAPMSMVDGVAKDIGKHEGLRLTSSGCFVQSG